MAVAGSRWRSALLASVALHGLAVAGAAVWPCHIPVYTPPAHGRKAPPGEAPEAFAFLLPKVPVIAPAAPPSAAAVKPPTPVPPVPQKAVTDAGPPVTPAPPGPGSGPPGHGRRGPTFFQVEAGGDKVVYVIDHSMSMGLRGALAAAEAELLASLQRLPPTARFQVIVYNSTAGPLLPTRPGWLPAVPENVTLVRRALENLRAEGGTHHDQALPKALALEPDVIFFLTDAADLNEADLRAVSSRNRGRSAIHVFELNAAHRGRPDTPLQLLARQNRGVYQAVALGGGR
jgi:Ca-activated chloride channel family protein